MKLLLRICLNGDGMTNLERLNLKFKFDNEDGSIWFVVTNQDNLSKFLDLNNCYMDKYLTIRDKEDNYCYGFIEVVK